MPQGAPGRPRDAQERAPGEPQRSSSRGCLREAKKAQGAPGARNGQFAKENVIEKQHFGDRLQKLGFWGLQEPKKAQGAPGARNGQFAKENVIEKQHFGDRLQKLGFWGLQKPKKAQGAPGARNGQFAN